MPDPPVPPQSDNPTISSKGGAHNSQTTEQGGRPGPTDATANLQNQGGVAATYASTVKRMLAGATGHDEEDNESVSSQEDPMSEDKPLEELEHLPGPIKGFTANNVYYNLDEQVQGAWETHAASAILVHYLDGGYSSTMALEVHAIADDIQSKC